MDDFLIELGAGVIATLLGVWLGRRNVAGSTVDNSGAVVGGDVYVDQSDRSRREVNVHLHNTQVVSGSTAERDESANDDLTKLVVAMTIGGVVLLALAGGYLFLRDPALLGFRIASTFLVVFCFTLLIQFLVRGRADPALLVGVAIAGSSAGVTALNRGWLSDEDLASDRLARIFASDIRLGFGDLTDYVTWDELTFLALQGAGLLLTGVLLLLTAWICIKLVWAGRSNSYSTSALPRWRTGRDLALAVLWVAAAGLSMALCSGWWSTHGDPFDPAPGTDERPIRLEASAKLSPTNREANLLCARVRIADDRLPDDPVVLERKVRRRQGAPRWQEVGTALRLSMNGTTCREVEFATDHGPYRFSIVTDGQTIRSSHISLVPVAVLDKASRA